MRIRSVRIKNFRAFADETVMFDPYTCLVGANGAGKSTVLCALNVFFREPTNATDVQSLSAEDFHRKNTADRLEITVTFHQLSSAAKAELSDYVRGEELIVSAVADFEMGSGRAKVRQVGSRMAMAKFAPFFKGLDTDPATELADRFEQYRSEHPEIPAAKSTKARKEALLAFEQAHPELLTAIESEDTFYGIAGNARLRNHVQWIYVPAVKNATDEQSESRDSALGKLLARTVRANVDFRTDITALEEQTRVRYNELLSLRQAALDTVGESLTRRLTDWCHPDAVVRLAWSSAPIAIRDPTARATAGEGEFEGDLARFGHGFQRSYLIALLQELSATDANDGPTLLLGCEEPELYQHPPQARYLAQVLQDLSTKNAQVCVTTHSPYFVGGNCFEGVRMVRKAAERAVVLGSSFADLAARYAEADEMPEQKPTAAAALINEVLRPQLNEMFFARRVVLVEGVEDVAYIMSWMALTDRISKFRQMGIHVVPTDAKSNLARPLIMAQQLGIPVFVVFDGDRQTCEHPGHQKDNRRLLRLLGTPEAPLFPQETVWHSAYVQWCDDIATAVDAEFTAVLPHGRYATVLEEARVACGQAASLKKNTYFIQHKLTRALAAGGTSTTLDRLCDAILA